MYHLHDKTDKHKHKNDNVHGNKGLNSQVEFFPYILDSNNIQHLSGNFFYIKYEKINANTFKSEIHTINVLLPSNQASRFEI